ncbi:MAG: class I SAM-dependent methyltransferase [Verrucomicrobiota bacterium]|nr:class I SAM-dependent methyltransferase [Verrucomicrobiota bacterium]
MPKISNKNYWDSIADEYDQFTHISCDDFHFGPLIPGDNFLKILPKNLNNKNCLEIGCGAAQNSIFLTKEKNALCTAVDISFKQIQQAKKLCLKHSVNVNLICDSMENITLKKYGHFDFIHASHSLQFVKEPAKIIAESAKMLQEGGTLFFSIPHPVFSGELVTFEDDTTGMSLKHYFAPPDETREDSLGNVVIKSRTYPISQSVSWILDAGLTIKNILEPKPIVIDPFNETAETRHALSLQDSTPYYSDRWSEYYYEMQKFPVTVIFLCKKV